MSLCRALLQIALLLVIVSGCGAPKARLTFPAAPLRVDGGTTWYDVDGDGRGDFATVLDAEEHVGTVGYDDDQDGALDRTYRLGDYADDDVPHLVLMVDSIPYQAMAARYDAGRMRWFHPPAKVIPPFPSLTEVCFTDLLHAPPLPGVIDQYYDPKRLKANNGVWRRIRGYEQPWERRLHYGAKFWEGGLSYLKPMPWFAAELERVRQAVDDSPDRVTVAYVGSASGVLSKYGSAGCDAALDGIERLCLQLLYERRGAIKITLLADHGHNFAETTNVDLAAVLKSAGFEPSKRMGDDADDVVLEINGLVTYAAVHTRRPAAVADALLKRPEVELAMYVVDDYVLVRSATGAAAIDCSGRQVRYRPIEGDPLGYAAVLESMKADRTLRDAGYAPEAAWLEATLDHEFPDAPRRVWDAFHRQVVNVPRVMVTMKDGYAAGLAQYEKYIDMKSTHGGLNQANSATFVATMTDRPHGPMRLRDVLPALEPDALQPIIGARGDDE